MKKNIFIIFGAVTIVVLLAVSVILFLQVNKLTQQIAQSKALVQKLQEDAMRLQAEKEKTLKENEKFQADAVNYLEINSKLRSDKEKLAEGLEDAQRLNEESKEDIKNLKKKLLALAKKAKGEPAALKKITKEKEELQKKVKSAEDTLQKERAIFHYNLGVAYTQAKLYDDALKQYEESLKLNPNNPELHYNLGLFYENYDNNKEKALQHYRNYLELKPDAVDREEVTGWIIRLEQD